MEKIVFCTARKASNHDISRERTMTIGNYVTLKHDDN